MKNVYTFAILQHILSKYGRNSSQSLWLCSVGGEARIADHTECHQSAEDSDPENGPLLLRGPAQLWSRDHTTVPTPLL